MKYTPNLVINKHCGNENHGGKQIWLKKLNLLLLSKAYEATPKSNQNPYVLTISFFLFLVTEFLEDPCLSPASLKLSQVLAVKS